MLSWSEIESRAIAFQRRWKDSSGDERQEAQTFEKDFMEIFGVDWREGLHEFQFHGKDGRLNYVDYLLPGKILIEMKSKGESLIRAYNQGMGYVTNLAPEEQPQLLLVSDFSQFQVTNIRTGQTFKVFKLNKLKDHLRMFGILAGYNSEVDYKTDIEVNTDASYKMAQIHDTLKEFGYTGKNLEVYLVRLLFCLFAEDTGIFERGAFERYLKSSNIDGSDLTSMLMQLFDVLDTPEDKRMPAIRDRFREFRYINGHVFSDRLPSAWFDKRMRETLISCTDFDWSYISPAIFGSMFQGVMDPDQRRELGAHYTSEENILKVIKPLFLDELWDEFESVKTTKQELLRFQEKLSKLTFLDPACGTGNFLIIAYRELRLLEFEILKLVHDNKQLQIIDSTSLSKVSIDQFSGIEYEEFATEIAQLGLLLMKHQMDQLVSNWFGINTIDFPIRHNPHIVHGNALRINWENLSPSGSVDYIFGNPPFVGADFQSEEQQEDMKIVFGSRTRLGYLDYVASWFYKASKHAKNTTTCVAFVSTNSITQGQQVATLWIPILRDGFTIDFAYQTFKWSNEARNNAAVHCVILGFSERDDIRKKDKYIFGSDGTVQIVDSISPYLIPGPPVIIQSRSTPTSNVSQILFGNKPTDGGNFILSDSEREEILRLYPQASDWIRPYVNAREFINKQHRWVLWLKDVSPTEIRRCPKIAERVERVRNFRLSSVAISTRRYADYPTLFRQIAQPEDGDYILVPSVSSERRKYIPMGFVSSHVIASNAVFMIPKATLYEFGILNSAIHMAWMRLASGKLKSDYRYSSDLVYNTFPWPISSDENRKRIELTANGILEARNLFPDASYADLYDDMFMPPELRKAHQANNKAVREAYGEIGKNWDTEEKCVADLMKLYQELVK